MIIQYDEGEVNDQVFYPLCTGIVFNCTWLLVQRVFKEVKAQGRSTHRPGVQLAQLNEMDGPESMV